MNINFKPFREYKRGMDKTINIEFGNILKCIG